VSDLPSHEHIERTIGLALGRLGAAPSVIDPETSLASLGPPWRYAAELVSAINERYELELTLADCANSDVRTVADLVLLTRLHLIGRALEIESDGEQSANG
jgi:hypothetical protein